MKTKGKITKDQLGDAVETVTEKVLQAKQEAEKAKDQISDAVQTGLQAKKEAEQLVQTVLQDREEAKQKDVKADFFYISEPGTNSFFFSIIVSILQILVVWCFMVFNTLENDADAGIENFYKQVVSQREGLNKAVMILNTHYSVEHLYPIARFIGAWVFVVYRSDRLFMLLKYLISSDRKVFTFNSDDLNEHGIASSGIAVRLSILLRVVVEFVIILGMCLAFVISPSMKTLVMDVNLSLNLNLADSQLFEVVVQFIREIPGMKDVRRSLTMDNSANKPSGLRGLLNLSIVLFVWSVVYFQSIQRYMTFVKGE